MTSPITHFAHMKSAIAWAQDNLGRTGDKSDDQIILTAMFRRLMDDASLLIEDQTGFRHALNGSFESVRDDISNAYFTAIQDQNERREAANDPTEIAYARADREREETRA